MQQPVRQQPVPQPAARRVEMPNRPGVPAPVGVPVPVHAPADKNKFLWAIVVALLVILALLIGAAAFLRAPGKQVTANISAGASPKAVPLMAGKPTMPQDIYDWLDHLRQTEDMKNKLTGEQMSKMMVEFTKLNGLGGAYGMLDKKGNLDPDQLNSPTDTFAGKIGDMRADWRGVIKFFEAMPPPPECEDLAHTYDQALDEISGEMGDFQDMLSNSGSDSTSMVDKLNKLQGQSTGTIDKYLGVSDDMVSNLCQKYNTKKWFKITTGPGLPMSSSIGGGTLPSLPGSTQPGQ